MVKLNKAQPKSTRIFLPVFVREGLIILQTALALYLLLAFSTYNARDVSWSYVGGRPTISNSGGQIGAWLADVGYFLLGYWVWLVPLLLLYTAGHLFRGRLMHGAPVWLTIAKRGAGLVMTWITGTGLSTMYSHSTALPESAGGILGQSVAHWVIPALGSDGGTLLLLAMFLVGFTALTHLSWFRLMDTIGQWLSLSCGCIARVGNVLWHKFVVRKPVKPIAEAMHKASPAILPAVPKRIAPTLNLPAVPAKKETKALVTTAQDEEHITPMPIASLLDAVDLNRKKTSDAAALAAMSHLLEEKLKEFNVIAQVVEVYPGPVVTRFEIQLAAGIKVSKITNLVKDIARSLAVVSVRVVEVIPGKSTIGIEVPNEYRQTIYFSEVVDARTFTEAASSLSLVLGQDISGQPVVADLARMPHLLVAGTTGSGKSVGVNAMILSLLFKATPDDVRLIMIDPKMLELSVYEGIPHLLTPVVTDMDNAASALRWCVAEMERRYQLMAAVGVRNLANFNQKVSAAQKAGAPLSDPLFQTSDATPITPSLEKLPTIAVIIDEFADMMIVVGKKVEELIARIAQKARAAGIHLILATQRPSVDVITGLIKANIPTRISFQVSSKIDSRTILDQGGAEQLLGHGDMLYLAPGTSMPVRVHGAFVSDDEVHRVVADWKKRGKPDYIDAILQQAENNAESSSAGNSDGETDVLYDAAVQHVLDSRKASISSVQRKLKIGYNRAARLIETMESSGLVSPMGHNGSREVLVPPNS